MSALVHSGALHRLHHLAKVSDQRATDRTTRTCLNPCALQRRLGSTLLWQPRGQVKAEAWFNQQSAESKIDQTAQVTQEDDFLESLRLRPEVRDAVTIAVEDLGGKATVGDVSARAGVTPSEAETALQALAADSQGTLQVSNEGDVVYILPSGFRGTILARSWKLRAEPIIKKVTSTLDYLSRIAFGGALVTSVAVVWLAIFAILTSANNDRDNRRSNGPSFMMFPSDIFFFTNPSYNRRRQQYNHTIGNNMQGEQKMNFFESIFSFVFGDGDPNVGWEERRWQTLGRMLAAKGGVATAEEMAPYLDLPKGGAPTDDEGYVVPALLKFAGHPEVDENGNLLYIFPDLQRTGGQAQQRGVVDRLLLKEDWKQTAADDGQKSGTLALGVANVVGVAWLSNLLTDVTIKSALANSSLGFVATLMPGLQLYAAAFFAVPLIRWLRNKGRNAAIEESNSSRREAAARLGAPRPKLAAKLESARRAGSIARKVISESDITYRSDRDLSEQTNSEGLDWEAQDFDKRLKYSSRNKTAG